LLIANGKYGEKIGLKEIFSKTHAASAISIHGRPLGPDFPTFIIAEAGVNHNGDPSLAKKLVFAAKACGADCVKFQTFKADHIVRADAPKASYQLRTTDVQESQLEMLRRLELPREVYPELIEACQQAGILFLSTPYDIEDIDFLDSLGVSAFKVASGQAVEPNFLTAIAQKGKPIILSTGMCTLAEAGEAVEIIRRARNDQIIVLQCTTNYPCDLEDVNLRAIQTMAQAFGVLAGFSDHTQTLTAATLAVGLGACIIERHFTLDENLPGPDHSSSSNPKEFRQLVNQIREAEKCLGSAKKRPTPAEIDNAQGMRRSIVASRFIKIGEVFSLNNLTMKRPYDGLPGSCLRYILGRKATIDIPKDVPIDWAMMR
jgi:N-acetylneuraminate synthase/N,N'-diacetyllegionaminate synthase